MTILRLKQKLEKSQLGRGNGRALVEVKLYPYGLVIFVCNLNMYVLITYIGLFYCLVSGSVEGFSVFKSANAVNEPEQNDGEGEKPSGRKEYFRQLEVLFC